MNRDRYNAEYVRLYEKLKTKTDLEELAPGLTKVMDNRVLRGKNKRFMREPLKGMSFLLDDALHFQSMKPETGMNAVEFLIETSMVEGMDPELLELLMGVCTIVVCALEEDDAGFDYDGTFVTSSGVAVFMGSDIYDL